MISGNSVLFHKATLRDLDPIKGIADKHRTELGFVMRPSLEKSIHDHEIVVATSENVVVGFVHYHHRRDLQTTLYHLVVCSEYRFLGIGNNLVTKLTEEARALGKVYVLLKCPVTLASNAFYERIGFKLNGTELGKERELNVWRYDVAPSESRP